MHEYAYFMPRPFPWRQLAKLLGSALIGGAAVVLTFCAWIYCRAHTWDNDFGAERQELFLTQELNNYKDTHNLTYTDRIPRWADVLKGRKGDTSRVGQFIANGYRDLLGNPVTVERVRESGRHF